MDCIILKTGSLFFFVEQNSGIQHCYESVIKLLSNSCSHLPSVLAHPNTVWAHILKAVSSLHAIEGYHNLGQGVAKKWLCAKREFSQCYH